MRASGEQLEKIGALVDRGVITPILDLSAASRGRGRLVRGIGPRRRKSGHSHRGLAHFEESASRSGHLSSWMSIVI
jgi:hypothetical protein